MLYAYDGDIGGPAPKWGTPDTDDDTCPDPPGYTTDGCVVSGRLSRLEAAGNVMTGPEKVLVAGWCQQYPSHAVDDIGFGPDGALYATAGEGASWGFTDYGQKGWPQKNPCGDPPTGVGGIQTAPSAEGGSLRAQDLRTPADPTGLSGSLIRVDPATGAGMANNPLAASADPNARRIVAYGLRNPFRFAIRPGTSDVYIANVGAGTWESLVRVPSPTTEVRNFGWPCYEGGSRMPAWDNANMTLCENLYADAGAITQPLFRYQHGVPVVANDGCPNTNNAISGMTFYQGGSYPAKYNGALFFADYARHCVWVMFPGSNGVPDPSTVVKFMQGPQIVDLEVGPNGDLFYPDFPNGTVHRIRYFGGNQPPVAVADADTTGGPLPLTVALRCHRLQRRRQGPADLRLGSGRRRGVRRLHLRHAQLPVHGRRAGARGAQGHRLPRRLRHRQPDHQRRRHAAHAGDRLPVRQPDLEGGRPDLVLRPRHRHGGRDASLPPG